MPTLEQIRALLESDPEDAFLLYAMAQELANRGEHDPAVEAYDRAIRADADAPYAYFHKARSLEALGRRAEARDALGIGLEAARRVGDAKAASEISGYRADLG